MNKIPKTESINNLSVKSARTASRACRATKSCHMRYLTARNEAIAKTITKAISFKKNNSEMPAFIKNITDQRFLSLKNKMLYELPHFSLIPHKANHHTLKNCL